MLGSSSRSRAFLVLLPSTYQLRSRRGRPTAHEVLVLESRLAQVVVKLCEVLLIAANLLRVKLLQPCIVEWAPPFLGLLARVEMVKLDAKL